MTQNDAMIFADVSNHDLFFVVAAPNGREVLGVYDWAAGQQLYLPVEHSVSPRTGSVPGLFDVKLKHMPVGKVMVRIGKPDPKPEITPAPTIKAINKLILDFNKQRKDGDPTLALMEKYHQFVMVAEMAPVFESSPAGESATLNVKPILLTKISDARRCYMAPGPVKQVYDRGVKVKHSGAIGSRYFELHYEPAGEITVDLLRAPDEEEQAEQPPIIVPVGVPVEKLVRRGIMTIEEARAQMHPSSLPPIEQSASGGGHEGKPVKVGEEARIDSAGNVTVEQKFATGGFHDGGVRLVGECGPGEYMPLSKKWPPKFDEELANFDAHVAWLKSPFYKTDEQRAKAYPALTSMRARRAYEPGNARLAQVSAPTSGNIVMVALPENFSWEPAVVLVSQVMEDGTADLILELLGTATDAPSIRVPVSHQSVVDDPTKKARWRWPGEAASIRRDIKGAALWSEAGKKATDL